MKITPPLDGARAVELATNVGTGAGGIGYDPSGSGLTSTGVQDAIDELAARFLEVAEVDGVPDVTGVTRILVTNGTLTDDGGGQVTIDTGGGGGGTPSATVTDSAPGDANTPGASADYSRGDHLHGREAKPYSTLNVIVNGRGSVPATGIVSFGIPFKFAATLIEWTILGDLNGTCTFDLWTKAYASYPPAVGDTMVGGSGTKPNIGSAGRKATGTPTSWAKTTFAAGDVLIVNLDAVATFTWLNLALTIRRDSST